MVLAKEQVAVNGATAVQAAETDAPESPFEQAQEAPLAEPQAKAPEEPQAKASQLAPEAPKADPEKERLEQRLESVTQELKTMRGNVRKQAEFEALLGRQTQLVEALVEHVSSPDADGATLKDKMAAISKKGADTLAQERTKQVINGYSAGISRLLKEAGIESNDTRLNTASSIWAAAQRSGDMILYHDAFLEVSSVAIKARGEVKDAEWQTKLDQMRKQNNQATGKLNLGAAGGAAASGVTVTKDNIDAQYMEWERNNPNSDQPNQFADKYREFLKTGKV